MSSLVLKIIALITMTIDHSGYILFDNNQILRFIGRIAFPIYAFLLVEGYNHTKNDYKRFLRYFIFLLILAFISEPIYDYSMFSKIFFCDQNILFTLSNALLCMYIIDKIMKLDMSALSVVLSITVFIIFGIISEVLNFNYGLLGLLLIFGFFLISKCNFKYKKILYLLLYALYLFINNIYGFKMVSLGVIFSLIPILLYNGKKGYKSRILQYFFYIYYPLHLLILLLIK